MQKIFAKLSNLNFLFWVYVAITLIASVHRYLLGPEHFNNYLIFTTSFKNLVDGIILYDLHPAQHFDLFKYSPTFAVLMAPFSFLPNGIGYPLWNLLNALLLFSGIKNLNITDERRVFVFLFILIELITSIQNSQSNPMVAGLIIWTFVLLENQNYFKAASILAIATFIKVFPVLFCISFLFYTKKFWKPLLYFFVSCLILLLLPLLFTSIDSLFFQYVSWYDLLKTDASHELNYSFQTFMQTMSGVQLSNTVFLFLGLLSLFLPLLNKNIYSVYETKLAYLALFLIWCVIFNHKAESPTFIIAISGMAIYFSLSYKNKNVMWFLIAAFILTSLSSTDLFPRFVREEFIKPYRLKVLPSIIAWVWILVELVKSAFAKTKIAPIKN